MLITYERFGSLTLPIYETAEPIGSFPSRSAYVDLPGGGAYRGYGRTQAPQGRRIVRRTGLMLESTLEALDAAFTALAAQRGRVDRLYGRRPNGDVVWTHAELTHIEALREPRTLFRYTQYVALDVETEFVLYSGSWYGSRHGDGWTWDSGEAWDSGAAWNEAEGDVHTLVPGSLNEIDVPNDGNATIKNAILKITAGASAITAFSLVSTNPDLYRQADFEFTGTIGANQTLVIDAGAQLATIATALNADAAAGDTSLSVFNSAGFVIGRGVTVAMLDGARIHRTTIASVPGSTSLTIADPLPFDAPGAGAVVMDAYPDLEFGPAHALGGWFVLDPGTTALEIELTSGANATLTTVYSDGWE